MGGEGYFHVGATKKRCFTFRFDFWQCYSVASTSLQRSLEPTSPVAITIFIRGLVSPITALVLSTGFGSFTILVSLLVQFTVVLHCKQMILGDVQIFTIPIALCEVYV